MLSRDNNHRLMEASVRRVHGSSLERHGGMCAASGNVLDQCENQLRVARALDGG